MSTMVSLVLQLSLFIISSVYNSLSLLVSSSSLEVSQHFLGDLFLAKTVADVGSTERLSVGNSSLLKTLPYRVHEVITTYPGVFAQRQVFPTYLVDPFFNIFFLFDESR